ncbi:MAG: hypothetical protein R3E33_00195 [Rhodocyclaceae bacterium]
METAVQRMMDRHAQADARPSSDPEAERAVRTRERLTREAARIRAWLAEHPEDRKGAKGAVRLSNRTDNESAKMATGKGVIQGYTGVATVDAKAQVVLDAQAHGTGSEQELLLGAVESTEPYRSDETAICADAGYHSEANLKALSRHRLRGLRQPVPFARSRSRRPGSTRSSDPLWTSRIKSTDQMFPPTDFRLADDHSHCICPAGKVLYSTHARSTDAAIICGAARDCLPWLRGQCLKKPGYNKGARGRLSWPRDNTESFTERMNAGLIRKKASMIAARFATATGVRQPATQQRLTRFTLQGRGKVDGQEAHCMVHNINWHITGCGID